MNGHFDSKYQKLFIPVVLGFTFIANFSQASGSKIQRTASYADYSAQSALTERFVLPVTAAFGATCSASIVECDSQFYIMTARHCIDAYLDKTCSSGFRFNLPVLSKYGSSPGMYRERGYSELTISSSPHVSCITDICRLQLDSDDDLVKRFRDHDAVLKCGKVSKGLPTSETFVSLGYPMEPEANFMPKVFGFVFSRDEIRFKGQGLISVEVKNEGFSGKKMKGLSGGPIIRLNTDKSYDFVGVNSKVLFSFDTRWGYLNFTRLPESSERGWTELNCSK